MVIQSSISYKEKKGTNQIFKIKQHGSSIKINSSKKSIHIKKFSKLNDMVVITKLFNTYDQDNLFIKNWNGRKANMEYKYWLNVHENIWN